LLFDLLRDLENARTQLAATEQRAAEAERLADRLQRELDEERAAAERLRSALTEARWGVDEDADDQH